MREFDLPDTSPDSAPYWRAANEGRLLIKHCLDCNAPHHYPRPLCPFCGSARTDWIESEGRGVVYAVSVMRRGAPAPYAMAYVTLSEGVTLMTHIVDCDVDRVRIGDAVELTFVAARNGGKIPMFRPRPPGAREHTRSERPA